MINIHCESTIMHHRYALMRVTKNFSEIHPNINISVYVGVKEILRNILQILVKQAVAKTNHIFYFTGFGRLYTDYSIIGRMAFRVLVYLCSLVSNSVIIVENSADKDVLRKLTRLPIYEIHGSGFFEKHKGPFTGNKIKRKSKKLRKLVYISRFGNSKYTGLILELANNLPKHIQLDVLGNDIKGSRFSRAFKALSEKKDNISFQLWTEDRQVILSKLNVADALLYCSKREGCPFTVMESIEASTLPIVTNTPGCQQLAEALGTPSLKADDFKDFKAIERSFNYFFDRDTDELISKSALALYSSENVEKEFFKVFSSFNKK